jgi:hypothetical protein
VKNSGVRKMPAERRSPATGSARKGSASARRTGRAAAAHPPTPTRERIENTSVRARARNRHGAWRIAPCGSLADQAEYGIQGALTPLQPNLELPQTRVASGSGTTGYAMVSAEHKKCSCCGLDFDFEIDEFLLQEIASGTCVIFAGAGVSTENNNSAPYTLHAELAAGLGVQTSDMPFPDLAEAYCAQPDGRFRMMKVIQGRFDYITKFRDLRDNARKFFSEIATMPYLNTFITTNWDKNFEECCGAKPFSYDPDMRFWEVPERRVLKIHGTIDDYSSIVATRSDYDQCGARLRASLIGAKLKECLAARTCIFVGYSLRDEDFREIYDFVIASLGKFSKQHYFVSPFPVSTELPAGLKVITTDGTHFMRSIKSQMCEAGCYLPDEIYDDIAQELEQVRQEHVDLWDKVSVKKKPQMLGAACYQDGLIDAYQLVLDQRLTGRFSDLHRIQHQVHLYEQKIAEYRKRRRYLDTAYFRGYQNALLGMVLSNGQAELVAPPRYFYEAVGEMKRSAYYKTLNSLPERHKSAFRCFAEQAERIGPGMVIHHAPWG